MLYTGRTKLRSVSQRMGQFFRAHLSSNRNGEASVAVAEDQPLRDELFSISQLEQHARSLSTAHEVEGWSGRDRLLPRLKENEIVLADAYELLSNAVKRGRRVTPASEWFLDNYHLIEEQIRITRRHLPSGYSR